MREAIFVHLGYAIASSTRFERDWLSTHLTAGETRAAGDNKEHYPVVWLDVGPALRWGIVDGGRDPLGLGPRAALAFEWHRGRCGDTLVGLGIDVSVLRDTSASGPLTLATSGSWRLGWDLPKGDPSCDR
jgi:hypothetical protein